MFGLISFLWDIHQQGKIDENAAKTLTLEQRVAALEKAAAAQHELLKRVVAVLEHHVGRDIDLDGVVELMTERDAAQGGHGH